MFEAKLDQAANLKRIIESIRDMLGECNFDCSDSGIALQSLDKSHIVLVSMLLGAEGFSDYRCDRAVTLGLNINSFATVLKCANNDDVLRLHSDDKPTDISLVFEDPKRDRISEFSLKLMDIDQEYLSIPETEYTASITMPSSELQRILRDLRQLSEAVEISANKEGVQFKAEGDVGNGSIHIKPYTDVEDAAQSVQINIAEPVTLSFNLQYFNNIAKAAALSPTVTLELAESMPAAIEYKLPNGHVRYYFAPKIDDAE